MRLKKPSRTHCFKLFEVDEAANRIKQEVDSEANIIVGSCFDTTMEGQMRVSVVATGIEAEEGRLPVEETPEVAAPSAVRRAIPRPAVNPDSGEIRPGARHAVRRAAIQRPASASVSKAVASSTSMDDDFEIDEQSVTEAARAEQVDAVATEQLATGTDGPGFPASMKAGAQQSDRQAIATVVDPNVAETSASAAVASPEAAPAKRGLTALGGLNLIRRVADSFGSSDSEKKQPYSERRLDKDDDDDGDLQIPAFLRRQAN